jgi:two-component sensor histidine kinase
VAGEDLPLPETGAREVAPLELASTRNNIMIQFVGLNYQGEKSLSYQYRLEGVDENWSAPTFKREVNYASLAPGRYRFLVRAVNSQGVANEIPASLSFTILPPIWQRWWFLMLVATLLGLVVYRLYRYRVMHLLEVERVRTRIASDLHDDIGSNLTRIAILSEVAHSRLNGEGTELEKPLTAIARISRESVASMSDIVWAINPKRDSLHELVQRMRRFAGEIFTDGKIEWDFRAPADGNNIRLGADVRRDLFLIFKESLNNTARHSSCTRVVIDFRLEGPCLILKVSDDGQGFDVTAATDGQGLASMQRRARNLHGDFNFQSQPGHGTEITLKIPRSAR